MKTLDISEERIMMIWDWCCDAYLQHNIKLAFPANANPTKTYQWRYLKSMIAKFDEWEFDEATTKHFIHICVGHCKQAGVLRKGLAALHQSNLLKICYNKLKERSDNGRQSVDSIVHIHTWLTKRSNGNIVKTLLKRQEVDEFCNLVKWYQASKISRLYLALSRPCGRAMSRLEAADPEERSILPKSTTLYLLRTGFIKDAENVEKLKQIFGSDWR